MRHINQMIECIVRDRHTVAFTGVMLVVMGLLSLSEHLFEKVFGVVFHIAYGFFFLGVFNILLAVTFIIMGTMNIENVVDPVPPADVSESRLQALEKRVALLEKGGR